MPLLDYNPDPLAQGLLGLGASLMTPRALGGGMGAGLLAFNQGAMQAQQARRQAEQDAIRQKLIDAQLQEIAAQAEQRKFATEAARQKAADDAARRAQQEGAWKLLEGNNDSVVAQTGNLAPTVANQQLLGKTPALTPAIVAQFARAGVPLETLQKVVESRNWGRDEVAGTVETTDAQGRPTTRMRTRFGDFIGEAMPKPYEKRFQDTGGSIGVFDPYTASQSGQIGKTMTPGEVASNQVALGNLGVARGNLGIAQQRLAYDLAGGADGGVQYMNTPAGIVALPKKPGAGAALGGQYVSGPDGMPLGGDPSSGPQARKRDATDAIAIIEEAEKLLPKATGSYLGVGLDAAAQAFGSSTKGAQAAAQLKVLSGALVSKMPKMSGPQSDKDVALYREMAAQLGDATLPVATRTAALGTLRQLQEKYAGVQPTGVGEQTKQPVPTAPTFNSLPPAPQYRGKTVRDTLTGKTYTSNGMSWVEQ